MRRAYRGIFCLGARGLFGVVAAARRTSRVFEPGPGGRNVEQSESSVDEREGSREWRERRGGCGRLLYLGRRFQRLHRSFFSSIIMGFPSPLPARGGPTRKFSVLATVWAKAVATRTGQTLGDPKRKRESQPKTHPAGGGEGESARFEILVVDFGGVAGSCWPVSVEEGRTWVT